MSEAEQSAEHPSMPSRLLLIGVAVMVIATFALIWSQANPYEYNATQETLHAGTASTLLNLGNLTDAEQVYTDLLKRSRSEAQFGTYHFQRGNIRFRLERYEEAIEDFQQVGVHDPDGYIYQARWNLAQAYIRMGKKEQATKELVAFQEEYGEELPQFNTRVDMALQLLEE